MKKSYRKLALFLALVMLFSVLGNTGFVFAELNDVEEYSVELAQNRTGLQQPECIEVEWDESDLIEISDVVMATAEEKAYWGKFSTDYYYNKLSKTGKDIWDALDAKCLSYITGTSNFSNKNYNGTSLNTVNGFFVNSDELSSTEIGNIAFMFKYAHPQYYFLSNRILLSMGSTLCGVYFVGYDAFADGSDRAEYTAKFKSKIDSWVSQVEEGARPEDKVKIAHDIIAENTVYETNDYDQSSYSMVCLGETVCAGYSATMVLLCNAVGIPCVEVTSDSHAWNYVLLHDEWYGVDVTWDDSSYNIWYNFYLKSTETLREADDASSHKMDSFSAQYAPDARYDSNSFLWIYYDTPYFTSGNYVYFITNDNTDRGNRIATVVETLNGAPIGKAPATVSSEYNDYYVRANTSNLIPLTDFSLSSTSVSVGSGEGVQLSVASFYPSNTTSPLVEYWSSANESIAIVDSNGYVTGIAPGTTTVFCTVNGITKSCIVTVKRTSPYSGNVNTELQKFTYDEKTNYLSGQIVVVEWIDTDNDGVAESYVPDEKPIMTFESVDGTESIDVFVTPTGTNTYYFDRLLSGLTEGKEYVFKVTSGNSYNISEYRTVPVYTGTSSIGSEGVLGEVGVQTLSFKTRYDGTLLICGETIPYEGNVNSVLTSISNVSNGDTNFISGNILIVEWINGGTESIVPKTTPKLTFESVDGLESLDVFITSINGTNTYYFDRALGGTMDISKQYIFRISLTEPNNTSVYKSMVATTNYMDAKDGVLWETDTQIIKYTTVACDGDNQLRIYAVNK